MRPLNKSERIADLTAKVRDLEIEREALHADLQSLAESLHESDDRWEALWEFVCEQSNAVGPAREVCCRILQLMSDLAGGDWCEETQGEQDCD